MPLVISGNKFTEVGTAISIPEGVSAEIADNFFNRVDSAILVRAKEDLPKEMKARFLSELSLYGRSPADITEGQFADAAARSGVTDWLKEHGIELAAFLHDLWQSFLS